MRVAFEHACAALRRSVQTPVPPLCQQDCDRKSVLSKCKEERILNEIHHVGIEFLKQKFKI